MTTPPAGVRVAVFIDYQNCYGWARRAFHASTDPLYLGHIQPAVLAHTLVAAGGQNRLRVYAGVYVGLPSPRSDPPTASARSKQIAAWTTSGVTVVPRPLRYPRNWPNVPTGVRPEEKGVDVKLALDAVMMAVTDQYDIAVLASCDSDLVPVAEALITLRQQTGRPKGIEVVRWGTVSNRIRVQGTHLTAWQIGQAEYVAMQDLTNYTI